MNKQHIIYGSGKAGINAIKQLSPQNVYCFADTFKSGQTQWSKAVIGLDELIKIHKPYIVDLCLSNAFTIGSQLKQAGIPFATVIPDGSGTPENHGVYTLHKKYAQEVKDVDYISQPDKILDIYDDVKTAYCGYDTAVINFENLMYGFSEAFFDYAGVPYDIEKYNINFKHGIHLSEENAFFPAYANVYAGTFLRDMQESLFPDLNCFSIGPQIRYAKGFYDTEKARELKKRLGKTLLCFPHHSIPGTENVFDKNEFIDFVIKEAESFDSLVCCIHFNDFNGKIHTELQRQGAITVTAGYLFDPSHVRRMRTIIELADAMLTNGLGTQISFCMALGVPIKYYPQKLDVIYTAGQSPQKVYIEENSLKSCLSTDKYEITKEQLETYEPFVGFSQTKTPNEARKILEECKLKMEVSKCNQKHHS